MKKLLFILPFIFTSCYYDNVIYSTKEDPFIVTSIMYRNNTYWYLSNRECIIFSKDMGYQIGDTVCFEPKQY